MRAYANTQTRQGHRCSHTKSRDVYKYLDHMLDLYDNVSKAMFLLCFRARLFINVFWLPAGKGLTSWLSFVMSNCEVVTPGSGICASTKISYVDPNTMSS